VRELPGGGCEHSGLHPRKHLGWSQCLTHAAFLSRSCQPCLISSRRLSLRTTLKRRMAFETTTKSEMAAALQKVSPHIQSHKESFLARSSHHHHCSKHLHPPVAKDRDYRRAKSCPIRRNHRSPRPAAIGRWISRGGEPSAARPE